MTKLDAVKEILSRCGRFGCNALEPNGSSEASNAERVLDEIILAELAVGWHFNTRKDVEIEAALGRFAVPAGTITIDTFGQSAHRDVTQIGGFLYDLDNNSETFGESTLTVTYTLLFDFDCIPYPIRKYLAVRAASEFHVRMPRPNQTPQELRQWEGRQAAIDRDLRIWKGRSRAEDSKFSDINILDSVPGLAVRGGRVTASVNRG